MPSSQVCQLDLYKSDMLQIINAGIQTTLQGAPRIGLRHLGFPYSGPADPLSMALANRLVDNDHDATCLEISYGGLHALVLKGCFVAVTGAIGELRVSGQSANLHETLQLDPGDEIEITPPLHGVRAYLSIASGFISDEQFGSTSTYLPARLGGLDGLALKRGDTLSPINQTETCQILQTPSSLVPVLNSNFALRACKSAEYDHLDQTSRQTLFNETFIVGRQATRMGISLTGQTLKVQNAGLMKSSAVFPGSIQCPPSGIPIVLLSDAQTTGGYPRIAHITRCDRHLLGQIRPGNTVRLLNRSPDQAVQDFKAKTQLIENWLAS